MARVKEIALVKITFRNEVLLKMTLTVVSNQIQIARRTPTFLFPISFLSAKNTPITGDAMFPRKYTKFKK